MQHAHNPVDWYPWCEDAIAKAKELDRPILLSIGYSACHWCHVMEHESFEDREVARYMNEHFVCVKVDREERPDLDQIYQTAHQLMTQRAGGWPLNVVLSPHDHVPFFAGTYFPRHPRHGMPGFIEVLERIAGFYQNHKSRLREHSLAVKTAFSQIEAGAQSEGAVDADVLEQAYSELSRQYDPVHGGFGSAPKFPHPTNLHVCLHHWVRHRGGVDARAGSGGLDMSRKTLRAMSDGGLYDQLGGGFCRYSVDDQWTIPHFEKMLYDNAQLLSLLVDVWLATGDSVFRDKAVETAEWVLRDMQSPDGGYYATLDADSEGGEGEYYVWSEEDVREILTENEWNVVKTGFGLDGAPNFEGRWHLNVRATADEIAERCGISLDNARELWNSAKRKLLRERNQRQRPARDEKILTSWNGLMIKGMAHAGRFLDRDDFVRSAERALDFLRQKLWRNDRLHVTTKDGKTRLNAYLDDYAFTIDAVLEFAQARWRDGDLDFAIELAEILLQRFQDERYGGFYFTSADHERLLHRHKPTHDNATPSGNGVAASILLRLGYVTGETKYVEAAEKTLEALSASLQRYPSGHGSLLLALEEYLNPVEMIVLRGQNAALEAAKRLCQQGYFPHRVVLTIPDDAKSPPGALSGYTVRSPLTAYVCTGGSCLPPIESTEGLKSYLRANANVATN